MFIKQPFDEFLEFSYERVSDEEVHIKLKVKDLYVNSVGVIHGGIISTLADVAAANVIRADEDGQQKAVTVDLNVSFLRPATGSFLVAKAEAVKEGRTLIHTLCSIYNDQDEMVAQSKAVLFRTH